MKSPKFAWMAIGLLALGGPALAEMCTLDVVPAATLLLPYFEVDLDDPEGVTTTFVVNNALPDPALVHVSMWTNWAVPTINFGVFLTGYDVVAFDLRDLIANGNLPITADAQSDPGDTTSPHGEYAYWDGSFANCENFFPFFTNPVITGAARERVQDGHVGRDVAGAGGCLGENLGDDVARGYITLDVVTACSFFFPNDPFYFQGTAGTVNQLWGDYLLVDPANDRMVAAPLVHIEADAAFDATSTPSNYTFYGRYTQGLGGIDHREPLGTAWGARYLNGGFFAGGTELVVWRDPTANQPTGSYHCKSGGPDWNPLPETQVICFDEAENYVELCAGAEDPACFPLATQKVLTGVGDLALPFAFGWCQLNLNIPGDAISDDVDFPASPPGNLAQSYVAAIHSAAGLDLAGLPAVELSHGCENLDPLFGKRLNPSSEEDAP